MQVGEIRKVPRWNFASLKCGQPHCEKGANCEYRKNYQPSRCRTAAGPVVERSARRRDVIYLSTVSRALDGLTIEGANEYEQAKLIFGKIRHLVEAAGGAMSDVVKVTIYVVNIKQNTEVWRARQEFFTGDFPCSTLVEVRSLATPEILVEIEAIACIGAGKR